MSTVERLETILAEMRGVFGRMPAETVAQLAGEIANARRVLLYGAGRTGLVLQAFAMRLMHLGVDGHFVGQLSAPPVGSGDLLLTVLSSGQLPTADALIGSAKTAGARIVAISARPDRVRGADLVIALPAQIMVDPPRSILPLGSPFELALALLCDLVVVDLMALRKLSNADLAARHANLL